MRLKYCYALLAAVLLGMTASALADSTPVSTAFRIGSMPKGPDIDGDIRPGEWTGALPVFGFKRYNSEVLSFRQGVWQIGVTGKNLFFSSQSDLPPAGMKLVSRIAENGMKIYKDDTAEFLFYTPKRDFVYQIGFNPKGFVFTAKFRIVDGAVTHTKVLPWTPKIRVGSRMHHGKWVLEAAIPLTELGLPAGVIPAGNWGIQAARGFRNPAEAACLTKTQLFCQPENMAVLTIDPASVTAGFTGLGKDFQKGKYKVEMPVFNGTGKPQTVECALNITSAAAPRFLNQTFTVAPGKTHTFTLKFDEAAASVSSYDLHVKLTDAGTRKVLFERGFSWQKAPKELWVSQQKKDSEFEFAHYPTCGKIKARVGNPLVPAPAALKSVKFKVISPNGKVTSEASGEKKPFGFAAVWNTGKLADGTHTLTADLTFADGKTQKKTVTFEMKHFPWENNSIGKERVIIPPFKPIRVDESRREINMLQTGYRIGRNGFWSAIYAQGTNILNGNIALKINKDPEALKETAFRFTEKSPDRVVTETELTAKDAGVRILSEYDYDGMCKMTLRFTPRTPLKLAAMTLDIPLKNEEAKMFHAMHSVPHFHPSRFLKDGQGVLWHNLMEPKQNPRSPNAFWSYIWFGGQYRGFTWFSNTDRDWSISRNKPMMEIVRDGKTVALRIHIVTVPAVRTKTFELTFGFMPTPVKPRPAEWRRLSDRWKPAPHAIMTAVLAGSYIWGTYKPSDPFPLNHDYSMAKQLAPAVRKKAAEERGDIEKFIRRNCGKMQLDEVRRLRIHLERGRDFARTADRLFPYMNPRSGSNEWEDFRVFQDEWHHAEYRNPVDYDEYSMYPCKSFRDFLLYYAKKLIDSGLEGIYYDNLGGMMAVFDPEAGPAWETPSGTVAPFYDVFETRELIRRTAVMLYLNKKTIFADHRPLLELHITNGIMLPYLSFAALQLDLERGYGPTEFHERFSEEHIRTETLGTHSGCSPVILCCMTGKKLDWITRTFVAYTLAFDLPNVTWQYNAGPSYRKIWRMLYNFGYSTPDVEVLPGWENCEPPVTSQDRDVRITVYRKKNGKTMAALADFGTRDRKLAVDFSGLGYKNASVIDAENGKTLPLNGANSLELNLHRHDFRLIEITGDK